MGLKKDVGLSQCMAAIKPEVLAPAGRWEALEAVVAAGADAVYLGGKKLNMRLWRSEFNFSDVELQKAVEYTHQRGVKLYVTLNNLYYEEDLNELRAFLEFLEKIQVDALIVQDLAVVAIARQIGLTRTLHASVQANIHNLEGLLAYKEMGFKRAIVSKDLSLEEVYWLGRETGMELEYFVHGDLCVAHTGLCLTSSLIYGESSNRGRCLKPCRWRYQAVNAQNGQPMALPGPYVLATKDLCLYPFIPQLIQAGIVSFKIEGRMREGDYVGPLVRAYREAVDRYWEDPQSYRMDHSAWNRLVDKRARNFTSGQAFDQAGPTMIGYSGEREPRFPGRPVQVRTLMEDEVCGGQEDFKIDQTGPAISSGSPKLAVRVGSLLALQNALKAGAETVYVGGEITPANGQPWGRREVREALELTKAAGVPLVVITPKITRRREMRELCRWFKELDQMQVDGLMVGNWGTWWLARQITNLPLYGDYSLNLANSQAADQAMEKGLSRGTVSLELTANLLKEFLNNTHLSAEIMAHGNLTGMILDMYLPGALKELDGSAEPGLRLTEELDFYLQDEQGQRYRVEVDQYDRTHVQFPYQLCLLSILPWLLQWRPASLRLEVQHHDAQDVAQVVILYRKYRDLASDQPQKFSVSSEDWGYLQKIHPAGYTLGNLGH